MNKTSTRPENSYKNSETGGGRVIVPPCTPGDPLPHDTGGFRVIRTLCRGGGGACPMPRAGEKRPIVYISTERPRQKQNDHINAAGAGVEPTSRHVVITARHVSKHNSYVTSHGRGVKERGAARLTTLRFFLCVPFFLVVLIPTLTTDSTLGAAPHGYLVQNINQVS